MRSMVEGAAACAGSWGRPLHRLTAVPLPRTLRYGRGTPTAGFAESVRCIDAGAALTPERSTVAGRYRVTIRSAKGHGSDRTYG